LERRFDNDKEVKHKAPQASGRERREEKERFPRSFKGSIVVLTTIIPVLL
jgi:hypothetical protein